MADVAAFVRRAVVLSLRLHEFAALVPLATRDVGSLARSVNLFAFELKHVDQRLEADASDVSTFSREAVDAVLEIVHQGHAILGKIETLTSSNTSRNDRENMPSPAAGDSLEWDSTTKLETQYLSTYLDALQITLCVMLQTHSTAKAIIQSRYLFPLEV